MPNTRILISSILPRLRDFDETNDTIRSINNDLELNSITHTVFIRTCGPFLRSGRPRDEIYRDGLHLTARGILLLRQVWITKYKEVQRRHLLTETVVHYFFYIIIYNIMVVHV